MTKPVVTNTNTLYKYNYPGNGTRANGSSCPTKIVEERDYFDEWEDEWVMKKEEVPICKTEDISVGAYRCVVCGDVGYYSGGGGIPASEISPERLERLVDRNWLDKQQKNKG